MLIAPFLVAATLVGSSASASPASAPDGAPSAHQGQPPAEPEPSGDIIVSAPRYGTARVAADREIDEAQILSFGAESIQDLLQRAAGWIEPWGEPPLLLINGKPIGYDQSILSYPAEALSRLEVLKREAGAEYGQGGTGRVVNLVLKKQFSSLNGDVGYDQPTAGGASGQRLSMTRTAISGDMRWNASARLQRSTALMKNQRSGQRMSGFFPAQAAVTTADGSELDPFLSDALGRPISFAALPMSSGIAWGLEDFVEGAHAPSLIDPAAYENVQPKRLSAALTLGMTRPIGAFQVSVNLQANQSRQSSLRGPAQAQLLWAVDHPASPFMKNVQLVVPLARHPALRAENQSRSISTTVNVNGSVADWRVGMSVNLGRSWSENLLELGLDNAALQQRLDEGVWQPWDSVGPEALRLNDTRGRQDRLNAQFNTQRGVVDGPAGPLNLSMSVSGNMSAAYRWMDGRKLDPVHRRSGTAQAALNIPINRAGEGLFPALGDLSFDLSTRRQLATGSTAQQSWSAGMNHQPWPWLQLRGSWDQSKSAPDAEQLDGPVEQNVQRLFDYARQEVVDVLWTTGGNPKLRPSLRTNFSLNVGIRAWSPLSYDIGYSQSAQRWAISSLPELTPTIEAAFADRIERGADGRLIRIDARPINLERQSDSNLNHSLTFLWPPHSSTTGSAAASAWRLQASINHAMRLTSELKIRDGVPTINQLGADSGQSRHSVSGQLGLSRTGLGLTLQGQWSSGGQLRLGDGQQNLYFRPPLLFNFSGFVDADKFSEHAIFKGLKISVDVHNVTRQYRRVVRADGSVPAGYGRDDVDPMGRNVKITLRKRF